MDKKQLEILTNIIGGVESGGQVYGQRRYEAYAGKRANSANEKTCTLGWAQNYGNEARKLCQMILKEDPGAFRGADTAGIESRLSQALGGDRLESTCNRESGADRNHHDTERKEMPG